MVVSEIKLYELLKAKIGAGEAEAFVQILENKVDKKFEEKRTELATKQDIFQLKEDMKEDMSKIKYELLKAVYLTSIAQYLATTVTVVTLLLLFIRK